MPAPAPALRFVVAVALATALAAAAGACSTPAPAPQPAPPPRGAMIVPAAAEGEVAQLVQTAAAEAEKAQRRLIVYVGATWCEPCREFHDAVARGEVADLSPAVTLLEFDLDRDKERLAAAGYSGDFVPLLAVPDAGGRATARVASGVQRGAAYVPQVRARLEGLLAP